MIANLINGMVLGIIKHTGKNYHDDCNYNNCRNVQSKLPSFPVRFLQGNLYRPERAEIHPRANLQSALPHDRIENYQALTV
mgnify:CR=1 FL=1